MERAFPDAGHVGEEGSGGGGGVRDHLGDEGGKDGRGERGVTELSKRGGDTRGDTGQTSALGRIRYVPFRLRIRSGCLLECLSYGASFGWVCQLMFITAVPITKVFA